MSYFKNRHNKEQSSKGLLLLLLTTFTSIQYIDGQELYTPPTQMRSAPIQAMHVGEIKSFAGIDAVEGSMYYSVEIESTFFADGPQDLIIKAMPFDYESDPDVLISKINQRPSTVEQSEWYCAMFGEDTCIVQSSDIKVGDKFYIGIHCPMGHCKYNLYVQKSEAIQLTDRVATTFKLEKEETKIFRLRLPSFKTEEISSVTIRAVSYTSGAKDFKISASELFDKSVEYEDVYKDKTQRQGATFMETKYGVPAWKKGQVLRISKEDLLSDCDQCEVLILVDAHDSGYYSLKVKIDDAVEPISNNNQIDDIVYPYEKQCYRYTVQSVNTMVQIAFTTYSGQADIRVNPSKIPDNWDDFATQSDNEYQSLIDLSSSDRETIHHQLDGNYFICVRGNENSMTTTYTIRVREYNDDSQNFALRDGYSEVFKVKPQSYLVHQYIVPKEEYEGEDLVIDVRVVVKNGPRPDLRAIPCNGNSTHDCIENIDYNMDLYSKGSDDGHIITLLLDPDERECQSNIISGCIYLIIVDNPSTERISEYEIIAQHTQNNHIMLQERKPQIDFIEYQRLKYYQFVLTETDDVYSVEIEVSPIHGNCDIFTSRFNSFPNSSHYEQNSIRIGNAAERITYNRSEDNNQMLETYYIAVYGYVYSTYSIRVNVVRGFELNNQSIKEMSVHLYEAIPQHYTFKDNDDVFNAYFEVDPFILLNSDKKLQLIVQNTHGKSHTHVKYGVLPQIQSLDEPEDNSLFDYELFQDGGVITIDLLFLESPEYYDDLNNNVRNGIFYVRVQPDPTYSSLYNHSQNSFKIEWRVDDTTPYLIAHQGHLLAIAPGLSTIMRHFVVDGFSNIQIVLKVGYGDQDIFVSATPGMKEPNRLVNNFKAAHKTNYYSPQTVIIKSDDLLNINPSCQDDMGYSSDEQCILYIGVYCNDNFIECRSSIELQYIDQKPMPIHAGVGEHGVTYYARGTFYQLIIKSPTQNTTDIFAVLTPFTDDLDLYVNIYRRGVSQQLDQTVLESMKPNPNSYLAKSNERQKDEFIHLKSTQILQACYQDGTITVYDDCVIVFGIFSTSDTATLPYNDDTELYFNFIAYKNIIEIAEDTPTYAHLTKDTFQYFIYHYAGEEILCMTEEGVKCSISVKVSSVNNNDVDLYVVKGNRLPTLNDYDMKASLSHSDIIQITKDSLKTNEDDHSTVNKLEGYYVFGIFGLQDTSVTFSVLSTLNSEYESGIYSLKDGISVKHSQKSSFTTYFSFYNWQESNIEISINIKLGLANMYITTFKNGQEQFMPSGENFKWSRTAIHPLSAYSSGETDLLILREDRDYCTGCTYIIGVYTMDQENKYSIIAKNLMPNYHYFNLLKIGESSIVKMSSQGQIKMHQFLINSKETTTIVPTVFKGTVKIYVSENDNYHENSIFSETVSVTNMNSEEKQITLNKDIIKTETNYFLTVECLSDNADLTILISQAYTTISLSEGLPQKVKFQDFYDEFKFFIYDIPSGNSTIHVNIKSQTQLFFPLVFIGLAQGQDYNNMTLLRENIYNETLNVNKTIMSEQWDKDQYIFERTIEFNNLEDAAVVGLSLVYFKQGECGCEFTNFTNIKDSAAEALITISHSQTVKLISNQEYHGILVPKVKPLSIFLIDPPSDVITRVEASLCSGNIQFSLQNKFTEEKVLAEHRYEQGKTFIEVPISGEHYIIVEEQANEIQPSQMLNDFIIKVVYIEKGPHEVKSYSSNNQGIISFEYMAGPGKQVLLEWHPLNTYSGNGFKHMDNVRYAVIETNNSNARLDQFCAVKKISNLYNQIAYSNTTSYLLNLENQPSDIYLNVFAISDSEQIIIPYRQITIKKQPFLMSAVILDHWLMECTVGIIIIFLLVLFYCYMKNKKLQNKLEEEVREVQSASNDSQSQMAYNKVKKAKKEGPSQRSPNRTNTTNDDEDDEI